MSLNPDSGRKTTFKVVDVENELLRATGKPKLAHPDILGESSELAFTQRVACLSTESSILGDAGFAVNTRHVAHDPSQSFPIDDYVDNCYYYCGQTNPEVDVTPALFG